MDCKVVVVAFGSSKNKLNTLLRSSVQSGVALSIMVLEKLQWKQWRWDMSGGDI